MGSQWPVWAVLAERPCQSDFHRLRDRQGVFKLDAEVADGAVHLGMAQQKLDRVDCEVEERKFPKPVRDLEAYPNGPDVLRQERALLANNAALVSGGPTGADGGKVFCGHGGSSAPPRPPLRPVRRAVGIMPTVPPYHKNVRRTAAWSPD